MNITLAEGGGLVGLVIALAALGKLALDWRRAHQSGERTEQAGAVTDAAAANAVVLSSMEAVHKENQRLLGRVAALEQEGAAKDEKIRELQSMVDEAKQKIEDIAEQLAQLQAQG